MLLSEAADDRLVRCCSTDLLADDERYYQTDRLLWKIVMIKGLVCFGRSLLSDDLTCPMICDLLADSIEDFGCR